MPPAPAATASLARVARRANTRGWRASAKAHLVEQLLAFPQAHARQPADVSVHAGTRAERGRTSTTCRPTWRQVVLPTQWPEFKPSDDALTRLSLTGEGDDPAPCAWRPGQGPQRCMSKECAALCHARRWHGAGQIASPGGSVHQLPQEADGCLHQGRSSARRTVELKGILNTVK
jgi:hypothetical protein